MRFTIAFFLSCLLWTVSATGVFAEGPQGQAGSEGAPEFVEELPSDAEAVDDYDDLFADEEDEMVTVSDPIEPFNRGMFWFNDKLYFYLLKPVARAFRIIPEPARVSVDNFFKNFSTPIRLINSVLQFKFRDAGTELARFAMNTTVGLAGFFDPAKKYAGLNRKEEDFGQTLGVWGAGPGFYIVLPLFGPANVRDGIGRLVDPFFNPMNYIDIHPGERVALNALDVVNTTSLDKDTYEGIKRDELDPYLFIRDAYAQRREGLIKK